MKCDVCGKRVQFGNNVSHSKKRVRRRWLPNIRRVSIAMEGTILKIHICSRCLRNRNKARI